MTEALVHVNWNVHGVRRSRRNSTYGSVISLEELRKIRRILRIFLHKTRSECGTFRIQGSDIYFIATILSIANIETDRQRKVAGGGVVVFRFSVRTVIF